jgi:hypothetical protein
MKGLQNIITAADIARAGDFFHASTYTIIYIAGLISVTYYIIID